jgi:hypothetical protein
MKTSVKIYLSIYIVSIGIIIWAYIADPKKKEAIYKTSCGVMMLTTVAAIIDTTDEDERSIN